MVIKKKRKSIIKKIIIRKPTGYNTLFDTKYELGNTEIRLFFKKRSRLGKILKLKKEVKVKVPIGFSPSLIENNRPSIRNVFIVLKKRRR